VGVLVAALYQPVWVTAVRAPADVAIALMAYMALGVLRAPPWLVVVSSAAAAQLVRV
jgi:chromate transporter